MSSLLNLEASFTRSITIKSTKTSQSYKKKWRALVQAFCRRLTPNENQDFLYYTRCPPNLCPNNYKGLYSIKSATNITRHLKRQYKIIVDKTKNKTDATTSKQLK